MCNFNISLKSIRYNKNDRNVLITNLKEYSENSWISFIFITIRGSCAIHVQLRIPKCLLLNVLTLKEKLEISLKILI